MRGDSTPADEAIARLAIDTLALEQRVYHPSGDCFASLAMTRVIPG